MYLNSNQSEFFLMQSFSEFFLLQSFLACYLGCSDLRMSIRTNNWDVETHRNKLEKSFLTICRIVKESLRFFAKYGKTELIVEVFYV